MKSKMLLPLMLGLASLDPSLRKSEPFDPKRTNVAYVKYVPPVESKRKQRKRKGKKK